MLSNLIDNLNRKQGEISSLLIVPLLLVVIYEVIMRYCFNAPTIWGFEVTTFLYGLHYMLGFSYTDVHDGHVKVDIFSSRLSKKKQAVLSIICTLVIFLPTFTLLAIAAVQFAYTSIEGLELNSTSWAPPIYPFKSIMALALIFLVLQGVSNLIKDFKILLNKTDE
ncbi:MAG: TRAP transporter small permease subunit [Desulfobacterales bacterium]|nr:TRAP transporter small permease subunit [Desulfobacterales bacterium]MCP4162466.1 TRAP transporter small permease subunit [Deltaproteobacteria bacterium]